MVILQYSQPSKDDLKNIYNFIATDSIYYAKRFVGEIRTKIKMLKSYPDQGRIIYPDRYENIKQVLFKDYRIIYVFDGKVVSIVTIHHQSRLLENIEALKEYDF